MKTKNVDSSIISDSARDLAMSCFSGLPHHDIRVVKRVIQVACSRNLAPEKKFSEIFSSPAERKAGYRLIENETLEPEHLIKSICGAGGNVLSTLKPPVVVISQDTTWFTFPKCRNVEGMGKVSDSRMKGFSLHTALALSLEGRPLGLLDIQHNVRPFEGSQKNRQQLPIEEKESYRWITSAQNALELVPTGTKAVVVSDRESDIFEYLDFLLGRNVSFVIRLQHNRRVEGEEKYIREKLEKTLPLGRISLTIPKGHNRAERFVRATIQATEVNFSGRKGSPGKQENGQDRQLWVLRLAEDSSDGVEEPIEWILYTDQPVLTLSQGKEIIRFYIMRWRIEEFHLTLKSGMGVENQRFEGIEEILRWILISAPMAVKLLEMMLGSRENPNQPLEEVLSEPEVEAIKMIIKRQSGRRPRKVTMEQAVKSVAFLGGWMGRRGDGPPGIRTFWRGWRQVQFLAEMLRQVSRKQRFKKAIGSTEKCTEKAVPVSG